MSNSERDRVIEGKEYRQKILDKLNIEGSTAETLIPPEKKDEYIQKLQAQLDKIKMIIDEIASRGEADFDQAKAKLMDRYENVKTGLNEMRNAGQDAWEDLHQGTRNAWEDLVNAVKSAAQKLK